MTIQPTVETTQQKSHLCCHVFIPGISLLSLINEMKAILPLPPLKSSIEELLAENEKTRKFSQITKAHFKGVAIQILALCTATLFISSSFSFLLFFPMIELIYLLMICLKQRELVFFKTDSNGKLVAMSIESPLTLL